ncbi:MAG: nucleoside-diphosphate kinase [Bacteroidales bacterium]|nr:nucleoside-diphosphate kinase [Bacteroidales bacterium]
MAGNITLTIIKPTAFKNNHAGAILKMINESGFKIKALKMVHLNLQQAGLFYAVHKWRPFYESLVQFMSSGPIIAALLEKENAVNDFRKLIGATDPKSAEKGSVRNLYGTDLQQNAVHGSDSDENAVIESNFFFSKIERF